MSVMGASLMFWSFRALPTERLVLLLLEEACRSGVYTLSTGESQWADNERRVERLQGVRGRSLDNVGVIPSPQHAIDLLVDRLAGVFALLFLLVCVVFS